MYRLSYWLSLGQLNMSYLPPTKKIRLYQNCNHVFEWTEQKIKLLAIGYVKLFITDGIPDISSIILVYLVSMLINYHVTDIVSTTIKYFSNNDIIWNVSNGSNSYSSVIFKPNMSRTIKKYQMIVSGINSYNFFAGIICLPKLKLAEMPKYYSKLNNGVNCFVDGYFKTYYCAWSGKFLFVKKGGYGIQAPLVYTSHRLGEHCVCAYSGNDLINKQNICVKVCVDCIVNNKNDAEFFLYFINGESGTIIGHNSTEQYLNFTNGKFKLNMDLYEYWFAISCRRCCLDDIVGRDFVCPEKFVYKIRFS